jgi:hypothetical protein
MMIVLFLAKLTNECQQETVESAVTFPEDDPKVIARLILFLYTSYYLHKTPDTDADDDLDANETWFNCLRSLHRPSDDVFIYETDAKIFEAWNIDGLATDAKMHALADRLDVPKLATEARKNHLQAKVRLESYEYLEEFFQSVTVVYATTSSTDRRLRDIAVFAIHKQLDALQDSENENGDTKEDDLLRKLLVSTPQYTLELLTINVKKFHVWCDACHKKFTRTATTCACGMRGFCGDEDCRNGDWSNIECVTCKEFGSCRKTAPEDPRPWRKKNVK